MSYILEALRRAQHERERGQVPGLNAQPTGSPSEPPPRAGVAVSWPVLGVGLGVALLGVGVWLWRGSAPAAPPATAMPAAVATRPAAPAPAALPVVVSAPPAAALVPSVQASAAAPAGASTPVFKPVPTPVSAPGSTPMSAPVSRAVPRLLALAELTPDQRRDLPPLVMGGSIWSESALGRFVIVNGQVVREGEAAAPGVTVESIGPKAVLLRWRDLRFEVPL